MPIMIGEGRRMSAHGLGEQQTPHQETKFWQMIQKKVEARARNHLSYRGDGSQHWPGVSRYTYDQLDSMIRDGAQVIYGPRPTQSVAEVTRTYDRLFHSRHMYDNKMHRDDRLYSVHTTGTSAADEDAKRPVPVLTSSHYGHRLKQTEQFSRDHVRIMNVVKGFLYKRGTGLEPPKDNYTR